MGKIMLNDIEYTAGGSGLPSVTAEDVGKTLVVDANGNWVVGKVNSGLLTLVTKNTLSAEVEQNGTE